MVTLDPDNRLIQSSKGHRVDTSDIGALLAMIVKLREHGEMEIVGVEDVNDRETVKIRIWGTEGYTVDADINQYHLWLDTKTYLPLKVSSYDVDEALIEDVLMDDLEINVALNEEFFKL